MRLTSRNLILLIFLTTALTTEAQRGLNLLRHDLEHMIQGYKNHRDSIAQLIISTSQSLTNNPIRIGAYDFSNLVIPTGSLILKHPKPILKDLSYKTNHYLNSKLSELSSIKSQLESVQAQFKSGINQFIFKGLPGLLQPQHNFSSIINGDRIFSQVQLIRSLKSHTTSLPIINRTHVDRVIDDTYFRDPKIRNLEDAQGRLFFEGRKTFMNTVFSGSLISGCCDRLRPVHTNRMMLKSLNQNVLAPIVLVPKANQRSMVKIARLDTKLLLNQIFTIGHLSHYPTAASSWGLNFMTPPDNPIYLTGLIGLQTDQPKVLKTLIFKDVVKIQEAQLTADDRFVVGIGGASVGPLKQFDMMHNNYLLKYSASSYNGIEQLVSGTTVFDSDTSFHQGIDASAVNNLGDFAKFVNEVIVRTDRPAIISGQVQFNAVPLVPYGPLNLNQATSYNILMLRIERHLLVGTLNGMRIPEDIVILPSSTGPRNSVELKVGQPIHIRGPRKFTSLLVMNDLVRVAGHVNGMQLPETVIPLHLNDFVNSTLPSNLLFVDGLSVEQLIIQGGRFDDIILRDVFVDAQSLVMQSVFPRQPDGSVLIRAPLRVMNLHLIGDNNPGSGLLNGFRPQELDVSRYELLGGRKRFLRPVEATECIFKDINNIINWTTQLIRVDRPSTIQTVQSHLAFSSSPVYSSNLTIELNQQNFTSSGLHINALDVEFPPSSNPLQHSNNWRFSPEFYLMNQALARHYEGVNQTGGRYRCKQILLPNAGALVNRIHIEDIVTVDKPFRFRKEFTMVGKVELADSSLKADRIHSNYPIDKLDLVQFNKQRIPIYGSRPAIRLSNLALGLNNKAAFINSRMINGISFDEFANSIMSLTKPQHVHNELVFEAPVSFEAPVRTGSSLNKVENFRHFSERLRNAKYIFEDGLQCNTVVLKVPASM